MQSTVAIRGWCVKIRASGAGHQALGSWLLAFSSDDCDFVDIAKKEAKLKRHGGHRVASAEAQSRKPVLSSDTVEALASRYCRGFRTECCPASSACSRASTLRESVAPRRITSSPQSYAGNAGHVDQGGPSICVRQSAHSVRAQSPGHDSIAVGCNRPHNRQAGRQYEPGPSSRTFPL